MFWSRESISVLIFFLGGGGGGERVDYKKETKLQTIVQKFGSVWILSHEILFHLYK